MPDRALRSVPIDVLHKLLRLDIETGRLYWRERGVEMFSTARSPIRACSVWNARYAETEALTSLRNGYRHGAIFNASFQAHRVVFAMVHGYWPPASVDHADGDQTNNRPENLRAATHSENMRNQRVRQGGSSQFKGVLFRAKRRKWYASAYDPTLNRIRSLGYFFDERAAAEAYDNHARAHFGQFARVNFPVSPGDEE